MLLSRVWIKPDTEIINVQIRFIVVTKELRNGVYWSQFPWLRMQTKPERKTAGWVGGRMGALFSPIEFATQTSVK